MNMKSKIPVTLPIRYGRISSSRLDNYTMVYSKNLKKDEYGQGFLIGFKNDIKNLNGLKEISEHVIRIERNKTKEEWGLNKLGEPFVVNWNWGVLGICINPKHFGKDKQNADIEAVLEFWKNSLANFDPNEFSIKGEASMVDKNGVFEVDWTEEMNSFDFLVSTFIKPDTGTQDGDYPNSETVARKMYEGNYYSYFINNLKNKVTTFQDEEIEEMIKAKYCVSQYLINMEKQKN